MIVCVSYAFKNPSYLHSTWIVIQMDLVDYCREPSIYAFQWGNHFRPYNKFITLEGLARVVCRDPQEKSWGAGKPRNSFIFLWRIIAHRGQFVNRPATWHKYPTRVRAAGGWTCVFSRLFIPLWATVSRVASTVDNKAGGGVWSSNIDRHNWC